MLFEGSRIGHKHKSKPKLQETMDANFLQSLGSTHEGKSFLMKKRCPFCLADLLILLYNSGPKRVRIFVDQSQTMYTPYFNRRSDSLLTVHSDCRLLCGHGRRKIGKLSCIRLFYSECLSLLSYVPPSRGTIGAIDFKRFLSRRNAEVRIIDRHIFLCFCCMYSEPCDFFWDVYRDANAGLVCAINYEIG